MSPWSSYPVIVPKADDKIRVCIDYRQVSQVKKKDAYSLPHMDYILDNLSYAKYRSKIDMSQAFHQIPLEHSNREITAFSIVGKGLFQYKRLPYGFSNAPASFQMAMDNLFGPEWQPYILMT